METTRLFRQSLPGRAELAWDHVVVGEGLPEDQDLAKHVLLVAHLFRHFAKLGS